MSIYLQGYNTLTGNTKYPQNTKVYWGPLPDNIALTKAAAISWAQATSQRLNNPLLLSELPTGSLTILADGEPVVAGAPTVANTIPAQNLVVGTPFSYAIPSNTFADGETPNSLVITVTGLAAGLSYAGGTVSGTPTTAGNVSATVTATDPGGLSISTPLSLQVTAPVTPTNPSTVVTASNNDYTAPVTTPTNTAPGFANSIPAQTATVGTAFSYTIPLNTFSDAETPNSLTVAITGLPAGLSASGSTINGTPTTTGVTTVTVTATDPGNLSIVGTMSITVNPATTTPPPATSSDFPSDTETFTGAYSY